MITRHLLNGFRIAVTSVGCLQIVILTAPLTSAQVVPPSALGISGEMQANAEHNVGIVDVGVGRGTGWVAGSGLVVTDHHVSRRGTNQSSFTRNGTNDRVDCYTVIADARLDISVLRCDGIEGSSLSLRPDLPPLGTPVFTSGYPGGRGLTSSGGVITSLDFNALGASRLGYSVYSVPGTSGSPVMDARGLVVSSIIGYSTGYGETTAVGSRASEIAPLIERARSAPRSIDFAVMALSARRSWIAAIAVAVVGGWALRRRGSHRWKGQTLGIVALTIAVITVATAIQVYSTGAPLFVG